MTSREAITNLKNSSITSEVFNHEIEVIDRDLTMLEDVKKLIGNCCINHKADGDTTLTVGEAFDVELFKDLLNRLGYEIVAAKFKSNYTADKGTTVAEYVKQFEK